MLNVLIVLSVTVLCICFELTHNCLFLSLCRLQSITLSTYLKGQITVPSMQSVLPSVSCHWMKTSFLLQYYSEGNMPVMKAFQLQDHVCFHLMWYLVLMLFQVGRILMINDRIHNCYISATPCICCQRTNLSNNSLKIWRCQTNSI